MKPCNLVDKHQIFLPRNTTAPSGASSLLRFKEHTHTRNILGRTPLDEWSGCCRDLCLITHNTHNKQTSMARQYSNSQFQ